MTQTNPTGGNGSPTDWWGPQDALEPIFPLHPTLGYVPPAQTVNTAPSNPLPTFAQWGFDNGYIGYVRNA